MSLVSLEGTKLLILMVAGATFAAVGLWLLLRPKPDRVSSRAEIFGMKFESSSAGLLVFLVGAAFLAVPLVVPERPIGATAPGGAEPVATVKTATRPSPGATASTKAAAPPDDGSEAESNDSFAHANTLVLNSSVRGTVSKGDIDVFQLDVPFGTSGLIVASAIVVTGGLTVTLLDQAAQAIGNKTATQGSVASVTGPVASDRYFVTLTVYTWETADYLLTAAIQPD